MLQRSSKPHVIIITTLRPGKYDVRRLPQPAWPVGVPGRCASLSQEAIHRTVHIVGDRSLRSQTVQPHNICSMVGTPKRCHSASSSCGRFASPMISPSWSGRRMRRRTAIIAQFLAAAEVDVVPLTPWWFAPGLALVHATPRYGLGTGGLHLVRCHACSRGAPSLDLRPIFRSGGLAGLDARDLAQLMGDLCGTHANTDTPAPSLAHE